MLYSQSLVGRWVGLVGRNICEEDLNIRLLFFFHEALAYYYAVQQVASGMSPLGFPTGSTPPGQPINSSTNEGRYLFNPTFHHPNAARYVTYCVVVTGDD